ncbi:hypothetical protein CIL05_19115 [Virgibacillus profundi]|uniref:Uncharacterized protein n=1 Tax=Virgibacillus profundi TaxID=2024555 RepID=A0A2A2I8L1_9BACI|nr:hypothetical protein [Virgibacillus profundi]PAV27977.1 hypothetical protein CIL05_19115 [Virgibacillus profundi]PXY52155.1 hypothetical protein CIT14_19215 [Virgibacillus profundi]
MNMKQTNLFYVDATELVDGIDYEVITETGYIDHKVERLYGVDNHSIDYDLIKILGLGVVKNNHLQDYYIFNAASDNIMNEMIRIDVYYQITHPEFDDKPLDRWVFGSPAGVDYLLSLLGSQGAWVISRLKGIFNDKKNGQVLAFRPRSSSLKSK